MILDREKHDKTERRGTSESNGRKLDDIVRTVEKRLDFTERRDERKLDVTENSVEKNWIVFK